MALRILTPLAVMAAVLADQSSHVSFTLGGSPAISHTTHSHSHSHPHRHTPAYTPAPYHPPRPTYRPRPTYEPDPEPTYEQEPMYHSQPHYSHTSSYPRTPAYHPNEPLYRHQPPHHAKPSYQHDPPIPYCAKENPRPWCLEDKEYPTYEIKHAIEEHFEKVLSLFADVADLNTEVSVYRPNTLEEETYLCPSDTAYVRPLRAVNTEGNWRIIVNNIEVHYQKLTQTTRIEECLSTGDACPLVPECYESKCLQKSIYHRFLVYDPYDQYFPFAIETFQLPASCACLLGPYTIDH